MSPFSRSSLPTPPRDLSELLLRDVASLLVTGELVSTSLTALRPECEFSRELTETIDSIAATGEAGENYLHESLRESGTVLPTSSDTASSSLITEFFMRMPVAAPGVMAAEVTANLRLLAQHLELKVRLVAEEALLMGHNKLCQGLIYWAAEWHACGEALRSATVRARAQAYVADLGQIALAQSN